jgi:hypothetical protein
MAQKMHSYGAKLQYDADGTPAYTDISDVLSVDPPKAKADASETTHLESTAAWKEFIPGFIEAGEFSWMGYVHKTMFNTLYTTIYVGRLTYYWKILFAVITGETTGSSMIWQGFISEIGVEEIKDEAVKYSATTQITGSIAWTSGS